MNYELIDNIEIEGIDYKDYPDFTDAFISSCDYNGVEMTEEEIEKLDPSFVYDKVIESIT